MGLPDEAMGFRLLATAVALSVALLVAAGEGVADLGWGLGVGGVVFLGGIAAMLGYLARVHGWRLLDAERPPVQPVVALAREEYSAVEAEIRDDLRRDGVAGALGAFFWLLALGLVIVIPAAIAGFVTNVLYNAYPLPELLVLGWVALGVAGRFLPEVRTPTPDSLDLEDRLYGTVKHATRTLKGMMLTLFAVCGLFGGAGYVLISVRLLAAAPAPGQFLTAPTLAVALLAFIIAPLVAGGYLICTMDGIQIDDNMHALDHDFKAIPGLYVIGDMSGNYFSGSYPCLMAGAAAGRSATFGRFAGQNAAAGI
jgi:hypothetical protein